uniref:Cysteine proteinase n=1 Tax=Manihot esculenta TaxID=3983 RepID=A0A2C9UHJ6_MANES
MVSYKSQCLFSLFILALWANVAISRELHHHSRLPTMMEKYKQWMARYGRVYKDFSEQQKRFQIFKYNVALVEAFNAVGNKSFNVSINQFADLTQEEFRKYYLGAEPPSQSSLRNIQTLNYENTIELPPSINWKTARAVTGIKDQGQCGSCWAFAVVAAVESAYKIKYGRLIALSEQQLLDCVSPGSLNNDYCGYGKPLHAYSYIMANGGLTTEDNYPYHKEKGYCANWRAYQIAVEIQNYYSIPSYSEATIMQALVQQPVVVIIDGYNSGFMLYGGGVFDGKLPNGRQSCTTNTNHVVLVIGYGTDPYGRDYFLIKNSWGTQWGEGGYARLLRVGGAGICGITNWPSIPLV